MSDAPTPDPLPLVTLLYGDDHQTLRDRVEGMTARMGDPSMADMNILRLDGANQGTNEDVVRTAAYTLPFLTSRRMVILDNPVLVMRSEGAKQKFLDMLANLPQSTALVLVQEDVWQSGKDQTGWKLLYDHKEKGKHKIHPLLQWARDAGQRVKIEICRLPPLNSMPGWITQETKRQGGQINPRAAAALASIIGSETGQARQEITKLLTFVDFQRPIETEDVNDLVAPGGQADVFTMVDALAMGDSRQALRHLNRLLEEQDAPSLFGMIVRQYRLILMAKEALESGITSVDGVANRLGIPPFPAGKVLNQGKRYSFESLNRIYHRLLEIDRMSKTGQTELDVALQTFIAEMGRQP